MHAPRNSKQSWRFRDEVAVDGLVASGLSELALGALTGWRWPSPSAGRGTWPSSAPDRRGPARPV